MNWSSIITIASLIVAAISIITSFLGSYNQVTHEKYKMKLSAFEKYLLSAYRALDIFTIQNLASELESNTLKNTWDNFISENYQLLIYINPRNEFYLFSYTECQRMLLKLASSYIEKMKPNVELTESLEPFDGLFRIWRSNLILAYRCVVLTLQIESLRPIMDWRQIQKLKSWRKNIYSSLSNFLLHSEKECRQEN